MSLQPTPPLADTFASLSFTAPSGAGRRITSKSLDALIAAILARIFTRLEQILRLWQAGTLPVPAPRARATLPHPTAAPSPRTRTAAPRRIRVASRRARPESVAPLPPRVQPPRHPAAPPPAPNPPPPHPPRARLRFFRPPAARISAHLYCFDLAINSSIATTLPLIRAALAPGLVVEATAPDGTIEAVRVATARGWAFGVQWHPEWRFAENADSMAIFRTFGDACRSYRTQANRKAA